MKIAIDALGIHYYGGGRSAILNLFETLFSIDKENEYCIFLSQPELTLNTPSGNISQYISPVKNRFLTRVWAQIVLPWTVRGYDLIHFTKNLGVFGVPIRSVVTMHDMTTLIYPEFFPYFDVFYWRYIQKRTLQQASKIVAVSEATASDVADFYQIPPDQIRVIYNILSNNFKPASKAEIQRVQIYYNLPQNYILHVGRIDQKKNLTMLVRAFSDFRDMSRLDIKLVLVGEEYQKSRDTSLHPTIAKLGLKEDVIFTGKVPDNDLPPLYSGASVTVFPSLHEGFGLAPIEAMACGVPLIAYSAGAVREVAGDAALILDEISTDSLASAICQVTTDPKLSMEMKENGLARAKLFKGEKSAQEILSLYEEVISQ